MTISRRQFLKTACAAVTGSILSKTVGGRHRNNAFADIFEPLEEARFYTKTDSTTVQCTLCPWQCVVAEGKRGKCGVRENRGGTYYTLVHGNACAAHIDPIEKKPLFHFKPGSHAYSIAAPGCNITCKFCQNWNISQAQPQNLTTFKHPPQAVVESASSSQCPVIAYTYSEPTIFYEYMADCAKLGKEAGLDSVMISNGFMNPEPMRQLLKYLSAVKVDFKAFDEDYYKNICGAELKPVLNTLKTVKGSGVWLELVVLVIPTLNDSIEHAKRLAGWVTENLGADVPVHFTRFHPMYKLNNLPPTPEKTLTRIRETALAEGIHYAYVGNISGHKGESTYCHACGTMLIERFGMAVIKNHLSGNTCPACGQKIPGIWI